MKGKRSLTVLLILLSAATMLNLNLSMPQVAGYTTSPLGSAPSCVHRTGASSLDCFMRGTDNAVWQTHTTCPSGLCWAPWTSLGGNWISGPSVTSMGANDLEVFTQGGDFKLWWNSWNGATWSGWSNNLGGAGNFGFYPNSDPGCDNWNVNQVQCFVRINNNGLLGLQVFGPLPLHFGIWFELISGLQVTSGPAASSWGANEEDVVVRGTNLNLLFIHWGGSSWSGPVQPAQLVPNPIWAGYNPACVSPGVSGDLDCFATGHTAGTNGPDVVWHTNYNGVNWSPWDNRGGGSILSGPTAVSSTTLQVEVFAKGYDGGMWQERWDGTTWGPWVPDNPFGGLGGAIGDAFLSPLQGALGFEETANVFDNSGGGFLIAHRLGAKATFLFSDSTRVSSTTHQLLFAPDYGNAAVVAGPIANPTTAFYEANGFTPLTITISGGNALFKQGTTIVYTVSLASLTTTNDYFLAETFKDSSHTVIVLYGITAPGTLASGVYFDSKVWVYPFSFPASAYIVHWQGTTPNVPLPGDTYTIVYHT